jgi:hypothetical protein
MSTATILVFLHYLKRGAKKRLYQFFIMAEIIPIEPGTDNAV